MTLDNDSTESEKGVETPSRGTASESTRAKTIGIMSAIWGLTAVLLALSVSFAIWAPMRDAATVELIQEGDEARTDAVSAQVTSDLAEADDALAEVRNAQSDEEREQAVDSAEDAVGDALAAAEILEGGGTTDAQSSGENGALNEGTAGQPVANEDRRDGPRPNVSVFFHTWIDPDPDSMLFLFVAASAAMGAGLRVMLANVLSETIWGLTGGQGDRYLPNDAAQSGLYSLFLPFIAAALALIVFYLIRAGFLGIPADGAELDQYAIGGLSALVGLGSDEVLQRLKATIQVVFTGSTAEPLVQRAERGNPNP